jgi:hypothetical protein
MKIGRFVVDAHIQSSNTTDQQILPINYMTTEKYPDIIAL